MRDATNQALNAGTTAAQTGAAYGANASTIGSALVPQLNRQLQNPSGFSQQDIGAMLSSGLAGAGGATAGLGGAAAKMGMAERSPMGFSAALDSAARSRDKAAASTSEGITARNADVKMQQQSQAGDLLSKLYGTNVQGQNEATGQISKDVDAGVDASKTGWLQNLTGIMSALGGAAGGAGQLIGALKKP
jgi:hypothetical protein